MRVRRAYRVLAVGVPDARRVAVHVDLLAEREPPVLVDGLEALDLVHREDACAALLDALALVLQVSKSASPSVHE